MSRFKPRGRIKQTRIRMGKRDRARWMGARSYPNFDGVKSDGIGYQNERLRWPSTVLGTFRHSENTLGDIDD